MLPDLVGFAPLVCSAYRFERAVLEQGIRGIDESDRTSAVILDPESEAHNTEPETGADHQKMFRSQGPDQSIVQKSKSKVEVFRFFVVPQRFCTLEDLFQEYGVQAEVFQSIIPPCLGLRDLYTKTSADVLQGRYFSVTISTHVNLSA